MPISTSDATALAGSGTVTNAIHCCYNSGFCNYLIKSFFIWSKVFVYPAGVLALYFIYHLRAWSLSIISSCAILVASSVILFTIQIASQVNQFYSALSFLVPWNTGSLMSMSLEVPSIAKLKFITKVPPLLAGYLSILY